MVGDPAKASKPPGGLIGTLIGALIVAAMMPANCSREARGEQGIRKLK